MEHLIKPIESFRLTRYDGDKTSGDEDENGTARINGEKIRKFELQKIDFVLQIRRKKKFRVVSLLSFT